MILQTVLCKTTRVMDLPERPNDALTQPTRARLFELLGELGRPAGTAELASRLELHPNGVRLHLEQLQGAGLVARTRVRQSRGRPRDMWVISPTAQPGGDRPSGYAQLGRWLARAIDPVRSNLRKVESSGREIGRELASAGDGPPAAQLYATLAALGFAPAPVARRAGALSYRLCNCPYRDAVLENADLVCSLHRGITRGLLDELSPGSRMTAFTPADPRHGGCLVEFRGEIADGAQR
jgi:predicted ArsR family transcriptional regulator